LDKILDLELDGRRIDLPAVESVVVLNIPCWGAGVRPWHLGRGGIFRVSSAAAMAFGGSIGGGLGRVGSADSLAAEVETAEPRIDDGLLEVFCVYSSFHIAQMQVGLSEPHRIGHARRVKIRLRGAAPMQTDGEPWIQSKPTEIIVEHHGTVDVLRVIEQ